MTRQWTDEGGWHIAAEIGAGSMPPFASAQQPSSLYGEGRYIMVVEDDEEVRKLLLSHLRRSGFRASGARDSTEMQLVTGVSTTGAAMAPAILFATAVTGRVAPWRWRTSQPRAALRGSRRLRQGSGLDQQLLQLSAPFEDFIEFSAIKPDAPALGAVIYSMPWR